MSVLEGGELPAVGTPYRCQGLDLVGLGVAGPAFEDRAAADDNCDVRAGETDGVDLAVQAGAAQEPAAWWNGAATRATGDESSCTSLGRHYEQLAEAFRPLTELTTKTLEEYDDDQLELIHGFLGKLILGSRDFREGLSRD
ncbi:hypothetical protein ACQP2E_15305 [Actinoplanes sp. CA-015351]|uniref:hypothetical protein n=1 Tax=Actinoplanes sp. CA-015351 TaxID=3239897 RepID=UPI003D99C492